MSTNIINYVKSTANTSRRDINRILEMLQDLYSQEPEQDGIQERIVLYNGNKLRTNTFVSGTDVDLTSSNSRTTGSSYITRQINSSVYAYDKTHTSFGNAVFAYTGSTAGIGLKSDGTYYSTIDDHADLNVTDSITISCWLKLPATAGTSIILEKSNQYRIRVINTNVLEWAIYSSGAYHTSRTYTYTPNTWFHMVATYKSTSSGQKLYINGVSTSTDSMTGAIATGTGKFSIFANESGGSIALNNSQIALLNLLHTEASQTWVTNNYGKLIDTSGTNYEITSVHYIGSDDATPEAQAGLCNAS